MLKAAITHFFNKNNLRTSSGSEIKTNEEQMKAEVTKLKNKNDLGKFSSLRQLKSETRDEV